MTRAFRRTSKITRTAVGAGLAGVLVLSLLGPSPARAAGVDVFSDFESDADLAGVTVAVPAADEVSRAQLPSHGKSSLRFHVGPGNTPGVKGSAMLTLKAGTAALPTSDWSGHVAVGWDFFSAAERDAVGRLTIKDSAGKAWGADYPIHSRGWTPFNVEISTLTKAGLDVSAISSVDISMPRGPQPINGYLDAFRLADSYPYDQSGFAEQATDSLLQLSDFPTTISGLSRGLDRLDRRLGHRQDPIDRRLRTELGKRRDQVDDLARTVQDGDLDADSYPDFNAGVTAAQRAVPRIGNLNTARHDRPGSDFGIDSADSMSLVYPKDLAYSSTGSSPKISMARGEYENVQAVVLPYAEALHDTSATVSRVSGPGHGDRGIDAEVDPVGSLDTTPKDPSNRPLYVGWTPDPIRDDLTSVDVAAGDVQPYWIRLHAGKQTKPGTYRIKIKFAAAGKKAQSMTVTARVWPVRISEQPELPTAFQYTPDITAGLYGITDPQQKEELKHQYWSFLNDYKIKPDQLYTSDGDPAVPGGYTIRATPVQDVLYIKKHYGLTHFNALYLYAGMLDPNKPDTWQAQIDKWIDQLRTAMAEYRKAGVAQDAYVYGFDEATGPMLTAAKKTFAAVKKEFPDLPIMTTLRDNSMGPDTGLTDLVDIWAPQQDLYDQQVAERTRARGDQAWWYADIATGYPLPNWFNGYPPIDARMLMGPMSHQAGVEGVLYYAVNHWGTGTRDDHPLINDGIFSAWDPITFGTTPGDGSLFYPGPDGPMASIRLENFRDGMEDYNLLAELRRQLRSHPDAPAAVRARAERALAAQAVVDGKQDFTENPARYRSWRDQVAEAITDLSG